MRYTKRKGDESTVRKVYSDDKEVCYGVVGTVHDLLNANILAECNMDAGMWMYIPAAGIMHKVAFGSTREDAVSGLPG